MENPDNVFADKAKMSDDQLIQDDIETNDFVIKSYKKELEDKAWETDDSYTSSEEYLTESIKRAEEQNVLLKKFQEDNKTKADEAKSQELEKSTESKKPKSSKSEQKTVKEPSKKDEVLGDEKSSKADTGTDVNIKYKYKIKEEQY